jgi:hypothetical protein
VWYGSSCLGQRKPKCEIMYPSPMKKKNDTPVSSTNQIDCYNITEILLKVVLNTITLILLLLTVFILHLLVSKTKPNYTNWFVIFFFLGNIHSSLLEIDVNKENVFDEAKTKWPTGFWTQYKNLTGPGWLNELGHWI